MDRFLGFGRRLWFVCRVFFGIEEKSIRAQNVALQKKLMQMRERKAMLEKLPEQLILSEVRKVVEEMQRLNETLNKTEKKVEEYFQSVRKEAHEVMEVQLEAEEATMREMARIQAACESMIQEKNAMNKEDTLRGIIRASYASMPQENIALKKEHKCSSDPSNSIELNVEGTIESKEKNPQDPST